MAYEVSDMFLEVIMLVDCIAHLFMFVCLFMYSFLTGSCILCWVLYVSQVCVVGWLLYGCLGHNRSKDIQGGRNLGSSATLDRSCSRVAVIGRDVTVTGVTVKHGKTR